MWHSPSPTLCELPPVLSNHLSFWKKCLTAPTWLANIFCVYFYLKSLCWYSYSGWLRLEMLYFSATFYNIIIVRNHWRCTIWAQVSFSGMILGVTQHFFFIDCRSEWGQNIFRRKDEVRSLVWLVMCGLCVEKGLNEYLI